MNKLKTLIADKTISIEQRHRDTRSVPNYANYFLTTNHTDALALTQNDRRYYVLFSRLQTKPQVMRLKASGHFDRIFEMVRENAGGLRSFLLDRTIGADFDPIIAPESDYKAEMLDAGASPLQRATELAIADAPNPMVQPDLLSAKALREYLDVEARGLNRFSDQALAQVLRDLGFTTLGRVQMGEHKHTLWSSTPMEVEEARLVMKARIEGI